MNGVLSSVHSDDDIHFLISSIDGNFHIGLYRNPRGKVYWEDGSEIDFTNWAAGHPLKDNSKLCTEMSFADNTWRSINCDSEMRKYICEIEKIIASNIPLSTVTLAPKITQTVANSADTTQRSTSIPLNVSLSTDTVSTTRTAVTNIDTIQRSTNKLNSSYFNITTLRPLLIS